MTRKTRKIIAFLFIGVFALTAPAVILYTGGYRYNWKKSRFEKTGIIQVETSPPDAAVFLNGVMQKRGTPAALAKLLPDDYAVRLVKPGYLPWQKTLSVRSGETTFAMDVTLFSDSLPRQLINADVEAAAFARDGRVALLRAAGNEVVELTVSDATAERVTLLARFGADEHASEKLSWSPDGSFLAFSAERKNGLPTLFIYPTAPGGEPIAVHELLGTDGSSADRRLEANWSKNGAAMMVATAGGLFAVDASKGTAVAVAEGADIDGAMADDRAYLLRNDEGSVALEMTVAVGRSPFELLATLPPGSYRFIGIRAGVVALAEAREKKILLVDAEDGEVRHSFDATDAVWEETGDRLLLWNDFEVTVHDPSTDRRTVITRLGRPISGCLWHPKGLHIIYSTDTEIRAIEMDDRDSKNVHDLGRFTDIRAFSVDPAGAWIRVVGSIGSREGVFERDL